MRGENEGEVGILGEISAWPTYMPPTIYAPTFQTLLFQYQNMLNLGKIVAKPMLKVGDG